MEIINKIVENDVVFFIFVGVLLLVIIGIIVSIAKDGKKNKKPQEIKRVEPKVLPKKVEPKVSTQEQEMAKLELEKVVKQMEQDNKEEQPKEITYEEEQEDNAIISYQELLSKVQGNYAKKEVDFEKIKNNYEKEEPKQIEQPVVNEEYNIGSREAKYEQNYESDDYDLRDLFRDKSVLKADPVKTQVHIDIPNKEKKFKNSEYISPVTGIGEYEGDYFKNHEKPYSILDVNPNKEIVKKDDLLNVFDNTKVEPVEDISKEVEVIPVEETKIIEKEEPKEHVEVLDDLFVENEEELNFKEFSDRIKNTDDFLSTLKDLRSKL